MAKRKAPTVEERTLERLAGLAFQMPTPEQLGTAAAWAATAGDVEGVEICRAAFDLAVASRMWLRIRKGL